MQSLDASVVAQAWSAVLASAPCAYRPLASFSPWNVHLPPLSPPPAPFTNPLINQCYRCLVPLLWGLMAERCGFTSHGGVTLSSGWLCQKRKPLDIPRTHIHLETQVVNFSVTDNPLIQDSVALTFITDTGPHAVSCFT